MCAVEVSWGGTSARCEVLEMAHLDSLVTRNFEVCQISQAGDLCIFTCPVFAAGGPQFRAQSAPALADRDFSLD